MIEEFIQSLKDGFEAHRVKNEYYPARTIHGKNRWALLLQCPGIVKHHNCYLYENQANYLDERLHPDETRWLRPEEIDPRLN
jgi:hypothetical protein